MFWKEEKNNQMNIVQDLFFNFLHILLITDFYDR